MSEHRISLDGAWDFQVDSGDGLDASQIREWRSAVVPMPWQAQFEDLRQISGAAWYRRHFEVDPGLLGSTAAGAAVLHFGAVDYQATVWLNGERVGEHEGGYLPFEFDVVDLLREGDNELLVRVVDATDDRDLYPDFPFSEVPHGKQSWYGPIGGIWQSVWLELRPRLHIVQLNGHPLARRCNPRGPGRAERNAARRLPGYLHGHRSRRTAGWLGSVGEGLGRRDPARRFATMVESRFAQPLHRRRDTDHRWPALHTA